MMRIFMVVVCSLLAVCSVSAQISRREGTDGQAAIYRLPPFERAVCCTKFFEGWHSEKHYPYVGYGHKLLPGERYSARTMTKRQHNFIVVVEDNFNNSYELEFDFNNRNVKDDGVISVVPIRNFKPLTR